MGQKQPLPIYTSVDSVKVRLANKVLFQTDCNEVGRGELPDALLLQLISDAETKVEQRLRVRYFIPFQSCSTGKYCDLPDHSQRALRTAVDLAAVIEVLRTDFGRGTHVNGDDYMKNDMEAYESYIDDLLGNEPKQEGRKIQNYHRPPPLDDVRLARSNRAADDGYAGMIINTDESRGDAVSYAEDQVNNPAASYVNQRPVNLRFP